MSDEKDEGLLTGFSEKYNTWKDTASIRLDSSFNEFDKKFPKDGETREFNGVKEIYNVDTGTWSLATNEDEEYGLMGEGAKIIEAQLQSVIDAKIPFIKKDSVIDYMIKAKPYGDMAIHKLLNKIDREDLIAVDKFITKIVSYGSAAPVDIPATLLSLLGMEVGTFPLGKFLDKKLDVEQYLPEDTTIQSGGAG